MCGIATFTMLVSTSSSTLASVTAKAMRYRYPVDLRLRAAPGAAGSAAIAISVAVDLTRIVDVDRHAGTERMRRVLARSTAMRTGTRCTTLVKLPVALSGGSRAKRAPVAGLSDSTVPWNVTPRIGIHAELDRVARPSRCCSSVSFRLAVTQTSLDGHDRHQRLARLHQLAGLDPAPRDDTGDRGGDARCSRAGSRRCRRRRPRRRAAHRRPSSAAAPAATWLFAAMAWRRADSRLALAASYAACAASSCCAAMTFVRREAAIALEVGGRLARRRLGRRHRRLGAGRLGLHRRRAAPRPARRCGRCRPAPAPRRDRPAPAASRSSRSRGSSTTSVSPAFTCLVVLHQHPAHERLHLGRDRRDVAVDLRVVARHHVPAREPGADAPRRGGRDDEQDDHEPHARAVASPGRWRRRRARRVARAGCQSARQSWSGSRCKYGDFTGLAGTMMPSARYELTRAMSRETRAWMSASRAPTRLRCALVVSTLPATPAATRSSACCELEVGQAQPLHRHLAVPRAPRSGRARPGGPRRPPAA